jgi:acetyl-CoA C-acetyltransferase
MKAETAIIGTGQTRTRLKRKDVCYPELLGEACRLALLDAGLPASAIDAVVVGSGPEFFEGVADPELWAAGWTLPGVPVFRVATGGTVGAAATMVAEVLCRSGYDTVIAVAGDKLSESAVQYGLSLVYSPLLGRDFAAGAPSAVANQASMYMKRYPDADGHHLARIGVKMRENAMNNPYAQLRLPGLTEEAALRMDWLSTPLRLLDSCPTSDAACALIVQRAGLAERRRLPVVYIQAMAAVSDGMNHVDRDWTWPEALRRASQLCYDRAGIDTPEIDIMEIYDAFSSQHMIWYEGLGLCGHGEGWLAVERHPGLVSGIPVNPSGGVLSNSSVGASSMIRQAEIALQLTGRAGDRQIPDVRIGLAHGWGGAIQFHSISILSKERSIDDVRAEK